MNEYNPANLIGITEFRQFMTRFLEDLGNDEAITIIQRSNPVAVVMTPEHYFALHATITALEAMATSEGIPLEEVRKRLGQDNADAN